MAARLTQLNTEAFDIAHAKASADQIVEPHSAHHDLPPGLRARERHVLKGLGLDQRQGPTRPCAFPVIVPITLQSAASNSCHAIDRCDRVTRADIDGLDVHHATPWVSGWPLSCTGVPTE